MYESFYQLQTNPFCLTPDPKFCFSHSGYRQAREYLEYALKLGEGLVMVTGRPGTGKTTLAESFLDTLDMRTVVAARIAVSSLDSNDLLRAVAYAFKLDAEGHDKATLRHLIKQHLEGEYQCGRRALLIIDEAQGLSHAGLDELRLLADLQLGSRQLLQLFLIGQEGLHEKMSAPEMEYFQQRVIANYHLVPLNLMETREYIEYRLCQAGWQGDPELSGTAVLEIYYYSQGVPRHINKLCNRLLLLGYGLACHKLDREEVQAIMAEMDAEQLQPVSAGLSRDGEAEIPELQPGMLSELAIRARPQLPAKPELPARSAADTVEVVVQFPVKTAEPRVVEVAPEQPDIASCRPAPLWVTGMNVWQDKLAPTLVVTTVAAMTVFAITGISDFRANHDSAGMSVELALPEPPQQHGPVQDGAALLASMLADKLPAAAAGHPPEVAQALPVAEELPDSPQQEAQAFNSVETRIGALLAQGNRALKENRLLTPALDSAYYYFQNTLKLAPDNTAAIAGIEHIVERYVSLTNKALDMQDEQKANRYIARGLSIQPDNSELLALKERSRAPVIVQIADEADASAVPAIEAPEKKNFFSRVRTFFASNSREQPDGWTSNF